MFGSNVPDLVSLIIRELQNDRNNRTNSNSTRIYYELTEMTPIELERYNQKKIFEEEIEKIEMQASQQRRHDYLRFVTDQIIKNASSLGVTVLMPHTISRDLFKKLTESAEKFQLAPKDKKNVQILPEHLEILNFECVNPMPKNMLDQILNKDVFLVCWNAGEGENKPVEGTYTVKKLS